MSMTDTTPSKELLWYNNHRNSDPLAFFYEFEREAPKELNITLPQRPSTNHELDVYHATMNKMIDEWSTKMEAVLDKVIIKSVKTVKIVEHTADASYETTLPVLQKYVDIVSEYRDDVFIENTELTWRFLFHCIDKHYRYQHRAGNFTVTHYPETNLAVVTL
jgi:hypothetical protein